MDERTLSNELGIPVIPISAREGKGIPDLVKAIHDVANGTF